MLRMGQTKMTIEKLLNHISQKELETMQQKQEKKMTQVPKIDALEMIRAIGEIKRQVEGMDNQFVQWVMRVGESRNILNNALIEFNRIRDVMREVEGNIPQFHKQPGSFRQMEAHIIAIIGVLQEVNRALSYVQTKEEDIDEDLREDSDRDYEEDDE
jgi:hypothetical protein